MNHQHRSGWAGPFAAALLCAAAPCQAQVTEQTVTITARQDTSIHSGTPGSHLLVDGSGDYLWLSVTAEGLVRRLMLRFDLSTLPAGAVVRQATLSLYESRARDEHDVAVHRLLAPWGEGASNAGEAGTGAAAMPSDATWTQRFHPGTPWAQAGGDYVASPSAVQRVGFPNTRHTWQASRPAGGSPVPALVADVQGWLDTPPSNHGWSLVGGETSLQNAKRFESRNNGGAANRPQLTLIYTPPQESGGRCRCPAAALGAGLAGLVTGRPDEPFGSFPAIRAL